MTVTVKNVRVKDDVVIVSFTDGHVACFTKALAGVALRTFRLEYNGKEVVVFNSRHQVLVRPCGFVHLAQGYRPRLITEYWLTAHNHILRETLDGRLLRAWKIVRPGSVDLSEIKQGRWFPWPRW